MSSLVNTSLSYKILDNISLKDKVVLEIGPGPLPHISRWKEKPKKFIAVDVDKDSSNCKHKIPRCYRSYLINRDELPKIKKNTVDIMTFSLEHIYELDKVLDFFKGILTENGLIIGSIPNEGTLAWGLGRCLTTRPKFKKKYGLNFDKIISWEHPNTAYD